MIGYRVQSADRPVEMLLTEAGWNCRTWWDGEELVGVGVSVCPDLANLRRYAASRRMRIGPADVVVECEGDESGLPDPDEGWDAALILPERVRVLGLAADLGFAVAADAAPARRTSAAELMALAD